MPEDNGQALPESIEKHLVEMKEALIAAATSGTHSEITESLRAAEKASIAAQEGARNTALSELAALGDEGQRLDLTGVVARRLQEHRAKAGVTQAYLSATMKRLGFNWSRVTVAEVENGSRKVGLDELLALAALYAVPLVDFLRPLDWEQYQHRNMTPVEGSVVSEIVVGPSTGADWMPAVRLTRDDSDLPSWRPARTFWARQSGESSSTGQEGATP